MVTSIIVPIPDDFPYVFPIFPTFFDLPLLRCRSSCTAWTAKARRRSGSCWDAAHIGPGRSSQARKAMVGGAPDEVNVEVSFLEGYPHIIS